MGVAFENDERRRRVILLRDCGDTFAVHSTMGGTESAAVAILLQLAAERPGSNLSITERTLAEIELEPFAELADDLHRVAKGVSISILAPEGKPGEDARDLDNRLWSDLWRSPWGGISSSGRDGRIRQRALLAVIGERYSPNRQRPDVNYRFEFYTRHDWCVRAMAPLAFEDQPAARSRPTEAEERQQALVTEAAFLMRQT